jgi:hypothetical protein
LTWQVRAATSSTELCINDNKGKFTLTAEDQAKAEDIAKRMQEGANAIENQLLKPSAAARTITLARLSWQC